MRAHYSFKSCQLVTTWHQLIRRKMIFKEPSVVTADPLTLSLRCVAAMGVTVSRLTLIVKRANDIFCEHATKNS